MDENNGNNYSNNRDVLNVLDQTLQNQNNRLVEDHLKLKRVNDDIKGMFERKQNQHFLGKNNAIQN